MYVILGKGSLVSSVSDIIGKMGKDHLVVEEVPELQDLKSVDGLLLIGDHDLPSHPPYPVIAYERGIYTNPEDIGANVLIDEASMVADHFLIEMEKYSGIRLTSELVESLKNLDDNLMVFMHDNPDPDAIASSMAFQQIAKKFGKDVNIYYSGEIGHPENEIFLEATGVHMLKIDPEIFDEYRSVVFIDFSKPCLNNSLPKHIRPDIVIDHHPTDHIPSGDFIQIDTDIGSASTLMTEHMINADIDIDPTMGAALLHGIKVDTHGFLKNIYKRDLDAIWKLIKVADTELLELLERSPMNSSTLRSLGVAISNRVVEDGIMTAFAGDITTKDDLPQIVDQLVVERDVHTAMVYGIVDDKIYLSSRSKLAELDLGRVMKEAYSDIGEAGGHPHAAAGKVDKEVIDNEGLEMRFREEVKYHG